MVYIPGRAVLTGYRGCGATALLMPVSSRKQLFNLPDDLATKIDIQFYLDSKEALVKSLAD